MTAREVSVALKAIGERKQAEMTAYRDFHAKIHGARLASAPAEHGVAELPQEREAELEAKMLAAMERKRRRVEAGTHV